MLGFAILSRIYEVTKALIDVIIALGDAINLAQFESDAESIDVKNLDIQNHIVLMPSACKRISFGTVSS